MKTMPDQDILTNTHYPEWDLSDLYSHDDDPKRQQDWDFLTQKAIEFEKTYQGFFLTQNWNAIDLLKAILSYEELSEKLGKLGTYASLRYYKCAKDPKAVKLFQETQEKINDINRFLIFFTLDITQIPGNTLKHAYEQEPLLKKYQPFFERLFLFKDYQKSKEIESILLDKQLTSSTAFVRLFDETMTDLEFIFDGQSYPLSYVTEQMSNPDPSIRRKAALALSQGLQKELKLFTFITNTLAKDKQIEDQLRGFQHPASSRHLANQIEPEVVEALISSVKSFYPLLSHRYYAIKAKFLGVDTLNYWDRNAPILGHTQKEEKKYTWLEAKEIVLSAYHTFSPKMASIGTQFFDHHWIDVPSTPGKTDGAFSHPAVPSVHPYILLNFHGSKRDVMTLAHELGHGIHQVLAAEQGYLLSDTPLTVAETASVFGEMLTFQSLLQKATTNDEKQVLLASKIDDMLNTVVRQIAFYEFELEVHKKRLKAELSTEEINAIWLDTQKEALGPSVHLDPLVGNYWAYISHFIHSPFYVYAYAFGDCLVNSLFSIYQHKPEGFEEKYINLLKAGGSLSYDQLLVPFDLNPKDPTFWTQGLRMIETYIDELDYLSSTDPI